MFHYEASRQPRLASKEPGRHSDNPSLPLRAGLVNFKYRDVHKKIINDNYDGSVGWVVNILMPYFIIDPI